MKKCINAVTRSHDYHKIETRADFEIVDEIPTLADRFENETVVEIRPNFYEQTVGPDCQVYNLYEVITVDYSEGYKRYVVIGDNLEPLPYYSFDTIEEAEGQISWFMLCDRMDYQEPDNYWVRDCGTLHRIAVVEEVE